MLNLKRRIKSSKGFTLIELLIVIAILGVLAAVVLAAINPAEQLARGRDSSRLQEVAQLGHAATAYQTAQGTLLNQSTSYTAAAGTWQNILVASKDISTAITAPTGGTPPACVAGASGDSQGNFCYTPRNGNTTFVIWTGVESGLYTTKAAGASTCTSPALPYFVYDSSLGKAGVECVNGQPVAGNPLN